MVGMDAKCSASIAGLVVELLLLASLSHVLSELLGSLLRSLLVNSEETLDFIADVDVKRSHNLVILLAGLNVEQLLDLAQFRVLLKFLVRLALEQSISELEEEL